MITRIGLDIGFGDTKAAVISNGKLTTLTFPSVLGQAQALSNFTVGLNGHTRRRATKLTYHDVDYYVGDEAISFSRTLAGRQDRGRIGSVEERVLALATLAKFGVTEANIVTGLPVMWFDDRYKIIKSLRGDHQFTWGKENRTVTIHKVIVIPQPFGGLYAHILGPTGRAAVDDKEIMRTYACLDVGWNTTDLSAIKNLQPVEQWLGGARVGVRNVIGIVGNEIGRKFGLNLSPHEVDQAVTAGQIEVFGEYQDIRPIIQSATTTLAQEVVSTATGLWGNGERMSKILIFGGGAARLGNAIKAAFPHNGVVMTGPGLANAVGFCYFAQREIWR